jgi:Lrp/AsnC family leucine-responsive transcriptional regulator
MGPRRSFKAVLTHASPLDLDATDAAILRALQENARASLRTIAKKIGVSVPTVSARLRNLEQLGIVRGYRVIVDPDRIGATGVALVVKTKPQAAEDVARWIAARGWARRVMTGRPGWILVDVTVGHREEIDTILAEVSALPEVADVQDYIDLRTIKDIPAPLPEEQLSANVPCFECRGPIHGEPVKVRLDGRYHYFCCHSCERLYLEMYGRLRAAARRRA